ncbi:conserved hypothetical protein [Leishmania infantum JPCM5]|uniref:Uncharacterized protein n=2 Tax=Leishmania infantum TaxID=5671 RepID=A4I1M8_LEIIN|nr:conserved hypothetical protein [Leishmania infantum JPCM5]CAC9494798.1 hypothetical_protein_-_conserved [Leishmania infantum]CAM68658.1 conserved hypothetical protein [Leishmania infantum JPCM5]SUZ42517.1 hypothetical_protein_-_conserved [Leishmania infantum]|eukprot:XP_001466219.1 conserved hypothetical protein [Leishmania infantum JPCM5]
MLSQALLCAVERDLAVARQLAHFHVDLYASEGDSDESGDFIGPFRHYPQLSSDLRSSQGTLTRGVHAYAVLSNPVQRPRQGTCAVLMELSRPLEWLSQHGRHRGPGAGVGAAARAGTAATTSSATSRHVNHASAEGRLGVGGVSNQRVPTANSSRGKLASGPGALSGAHVASLASHSNAGMDAASPSGASGLPLLIATAALEVVFPARYPSEPCQWQLFEEVSFGGVGDHSTSSWAVTAGHHRGSTTGGSSSGRSQPHQLHGSTSRSRTSSPVWYARSGAGDGACGTAGPPDSSFPFSDHGRADGTASRVADTATPTLTAFVVSDVGRRLLRWIAEARAGTGDSLILSSPSLVSMMASNATANVRGGQEHQYGSGINKTYPFLLDFAMLLRYWSAVELDVHHLILPSRIAMAYGGGSARVPPVMTSMHLSGGGGAAVAAAAATAVGVSAPVAGGSLPGSAAAAAAASSKMGGTSVAASSPSAQSTAASTSASAAIGGGALYGGATSSTASVPAPAPGAAAATGGGVSSGVVATSAGAGVSVLYPSRRRPAKSFMAVLLPQGDVAVLGTPMPARRARHGVSTTTAGSNGDGSGATALRPPFRRLPLCLRHIYAGPQDADGTEKMRAGTVVSCTSQFELGKALPSYVLPAHVLGTMYKCGWDSVRLFSGKTANATLHANAKLAKALRLPDVSDLLQVLRRLAKNVGTPSTGVLYVGVVLWPALMETVRALRDRRLPFWAGLAVCSLLLPGVLQQVDSGRQAEPGSGGRSGRGRVPVSILPADSDQPAVGGNPPSQLRRRHLAELIEVVSFTERVLAVAQEHTLLCEVRLVRFSLQRLLPLLQRGEVCGHHRVSAADDRIATAAHTCLIHSDPSKCTAACAPAGLLPLAPLVASSAEMCRRVHAPISVCAVCGLSLLRNTVTHADVSGSGSATAASAPLTEMRHRSHAAASVERDSDTLRRKKDRDDGRPVDGTASSKSGPEATRATPRTLREEGCLVVQCARCGHGGHVEHISSWWNDPTVRCCPKGCDCRCVY